MRKVLFILTALALPLTMISMESGVAQAMPVFPGNVTCNTAGGAWAGSIHFSPPLKNTGTANAETFKVVAKLGASGTGCISSTTNPGTVLGAIKGKLKFAIAGSANNCTTIFSGTALPAPVGAASKFVMDWLHPAGAPTQWKHPLPFSVTGALAQTNIAITGGTVTGSFSPYLTPTSTLSGTGWPATVTAGCASAAGLSSLPLSQSTGTW